MFRRSMWNAEAGIDLEPYIDNVRISRSITGTIHIRVEERTASYMIYLGRNVRIY